MTVAVLSLILLGLFDASIGTVLANDVGDCPRMITKDQWNALPPSEEIDVMKTPVDNVVILDTASNPCMSQERCTFKTQMIQAHHMLGLGWKDIGYSFLIGGDGNVYEGRGWDKEGGSFVDGWNDKSVGIAFIGLFDDVEPSEKMMSAARRLLDCGKAGGFLTEKFRVFGDRQVTEERSPGEKLYALIQQWPEWTANP